MYKGAAAAAVTWREEKLQRNEAFKVGPKKLLTATFMLSCWETDFLYLASLRGS